MQLDWIEDILAVVDTGSLARAAERRFVTQSAFTRRIRLIEDKIGVTLFDRSRKPVAVMPGVQALVPDLRDLGQRLRRLNYDLRMSERSSGGGVTFVCQHAITATISPQIVQVLTAQDEMSVRVRSGNRDECLMLVLSGEVDFAVTYEAAGEQLPLPLKGFEAADIGKDQLVPVCRPDLHVMAEDPVIPTIGYPPEVFFGHIFRQQIEPRLPDHTVISLKAETALTLAAREYALGGIGIAWLPLMLVSKHLNERRLKLIDWLPTQPLHLKMIRFAGERNDRQDRAWNALLTQFSFRVD